MSSIEYVDVAAARGAPGVRIVVSGLVPSPWSEATKGLFRIANIPVLAVRRGRDATEVTAWTGIDNVPIVFHGDEPARTNWAAITSLASRLAGPGVLLPSDLPARADAMGLLNEIAGEDGIGWNARLAMIDTSLTTSGTRGFPLPVAQYLARRYGHSPSTAALARTRIASQLHALRDRLLAQLSLGHTYFGGARPSAIDVYSATFLTALSSISADDCPQLTPGLRQAFGTAHEAFGSLVPDELWSHRTHMFQHHLAWPITL